MPPALPKLALVLALALPGRTEAGVIEGLVDVRLALRAPEARPSVAELGAPPPRAAPDRRRSIVFLESAPRGAFEDAARPPARLDQRDEAFHPYALAVLVGTTVEFPNNDRTYHNVFSFSKPRRFDLGRYPRGQSRGVRFDTPGVVRVFCDIHAHMSAYILVFAHPYFATTDSQGRYRIAGVPPGTYTLAVWTDGEVRATRQVTVAESAQPASLDFVVQ